MVMDGPLGARHPESGPFTYRNPSFVEMIGVATGLGEQSKQALVIDYVHGASTLIDGMQKRHPQHRYAILSATHNVLDKISGSDLQRIVADVRDPLPINDESVDVITDRYGFKDLPHDFQGGFDFQLYAMREVFRVLKPGGRLIIADMIAPDESSQEWLNQHHRLKQRLSGRDTARNGECYIPTEGGWLAKLKAAGFKVEVIGYHTSNVVTQNWVNGGQITEEQRKIMDRNILSAPDEVKSAFNIRQEADGVHIDYPVVVIRATKPEVPAFDQMELGATMEVYHG